MKRNNIFSALMMAVAIAFTFTSCDDDPWHDRWDYYDYSQGWYDDYNWYDDAFDYGTNTLNQEAQALRGYWTGKIENRIYDNNNKLVDAVQMDATFEFDQYNANSLNGRGRETDTAPAIDDNGNYMYDGNGQMIYDTQELRFSWYIDPKTGNINIKYDNSGYTYQAAWNGGFSLNTATGQFWGTFTGINCNEDIAFDLTRTTLAKPNADFEGTGLADSDKGQTFGTCNTASGGGFSAPMKLRKR